ncbi:MAG: DDE-type integrase/transposase/recombinase, partial [Clostridiaceae bacterium]|nr:DDE-type integrase/transposase/recombinase [Clostridiaceae bacterium]
MIAPLLMPDLEASEKRKIRSEILEREGISERTLRRYLAAYRKENYEGLKPKERNDAGQLKAIPEEVLNHAITLKKELPGRSVERIIRILEGEGIAGKGEISRSTLSRHLKNMGFATADLKQTKASGQAARRFQKSGRNMLWQSDIKYGPYIPTEKGGKKRTYMVAFIDDATRLVCHAEFYDNQRLPILEDCFRKAVLKYGKPDAVYVDNGKVFLSRWFRVACAKLGIKHMNTKSYSPESKGKIERFNSTVEAFLEELSLEKAKNLEELNRKFRIWLDEGYNNKEHSSLKGQSPMQAYTGDARKVRFATPEDCHDAFLWEDTRKVDNTGCFKLNGIEYEAGIEYIRKKVDIRYDPFDMSQVEIWHNGEKRRTVNPLKIGEYCGRTEKAESAVKVSRSR